MFPFMTDEETSSPPPSVIVQAEHEPPAVAASDNRGSTNNLALKRFNFDVWAIPTGLFLMLGVPVMMLFSDLFLDGPLRSMEDEVCLTSLGSGLMLLGYGIVRRKAGRGRIILGLVLMLVVPITLAYSTGALSLFGGGPTEGESALCCLSFIAGLVLVAAGNSQDEHTAVIARDHPTITSKPTPWVLMIAIAFLAPTILGLLAGNNSIVLLCGLISAGCFLLHSNMNQPET